ncbi:T family of potassium channels 18-like isoform X1 [Brachionus plicatilis]|uniref:T family of potassium channels 18-like isoform X1 n=1 Tax=Brachionus plicatilis TaxID=10195 RepID=A0A3M7T0Z0_BRAPC|nr:T family of potassium channels 18-like isoform X1 [Brachionus plicatilis]
MKLKKAEKIDFSNYCSNIIRFGDVGPETLMGKIFLITYLTIGLPLTCLLLSDLGSIFTQILKFNFHFIETIYAKEPSIKDPFDETDNEDSKTVSSIYSSDFEEKGFFQLFLEIVVSSIEKSNDKFDFSISIVFGLVLFFITSSAFIISRLNNVPLSNGCYYGVIALNKINILDLKITNTFIFVLLTIYFLLGLAFFDLTLLTLQEKIRNLIIINGKNLINEVCKFANQLGYNWRDELIISVLENLGTNSFFKSRNLSLKLTEEQETTSSEVSVTPKNRNGKKFRYQFENNVKKSDKQTQITTLLFSKYRMDSKGQSPLSASCSNLSDFSNSPIQTASIRSSTLYVDKLIEENLNRREMDLKSENSRSKHKKSDRFSFESPISFKNLPNKLKFSQLFLK